MKGKVGIVSCYFKHNYGSMLQAYATQKVLDDMNIDNETINIDKNIDFKNGKKKYYLGQIFNFPFIKSKFGMVKLKLYKKINKELGRNISIRDKKYKSFIKEFKLTRPYETYEELNNKSKEYSSVIVGSDQLWLPVNVIADYYTLNWVDDNTNKIAYATSFGVSIIPNKYKDKYKEFLNKINYISVREQVGKSIVKEITNKNIPVVCDPTLLISKDEWNELASKRRVVKDKYILCYFLGKNIEHRKFVERLKEETGFKIVSLNHADEYVKYSDEFADITPYNVGPKEFLNLINNAEYVCTDSFHGTIFSLIYNKEFFTFRRYKNTKFSTNSRIDSLLKKVKLEKRLLNGDENIDKVIGKKIDYEKVNAILDKFINSSKEFLIESLSKEVK